MRRMWGFHGRLNPQISCVKNVSDGVAGQFQLVALALAQEGYYSWARSYFQFLNLLFQYFRRVLKHLGLKILGRLAE